MITYNAACFTHGIYILNLIINLINYVCYLPLKSF